jgi:hypothetical protein
MAGHRLFGVDAMLEEGDVRDRALGWGRGWLSAATAALGTALFTVSGHTSEFETDLGTRKV